MKTELSSEDITQINNLLEEIDFGLSIHDIVTRAYLSGYNQGTGDTDKAFAKFVKGKKANLFINEEYSVQ